MDKMYQLFDGQWIDLSHVLVVGNSFYEPCCFQFRIDFMFGSNTFAGWYPDDSIVYDSVKGKDTSGWNERDYERQWEQFREVAMIEFEAKRSAFVEDLKRFKNQ